MTRRQWLCSSGTLLVLGVLGAALPGCGGGDETALVEPPEPVIVNPSPEALKSEAEPPRKK